MNAADLKQPLWRVVYTKAANLHSSGDAAGPWHPDKDHVERCAALLRGLTVARAGSSTPSLLGPGPGAAQPTRGPTGTPLPGRAAPDDGARRSQCMAGRLPRSMKNTTTPVTET